MGRAVSNSWCWLCDYVKCSDGIMSTSASPLRHPMLVPGRSEHPRQSFGTQLALPLFYLTARIPGGVCWAFAHNYLPRTFVKLQLHAREALYDYFPNKRNRYSTLQHWQVAHRTTPGLRNLKVIQYIMCLACRLRYYIRPAWGCGAPVLALRACFPNTPHRATFVYNEPKL